MKPGHRPIEEVVPFVYGRADPPALFIDVPGRIRATGYSVPNKATLKLIARVAIRELRERGIDDVLIVACIDGVRVS